MTHPLALALRSHAERIVLPKDPNSPPLPDAATEAGGGERGGGGGRRVRGEQEGLISGGSVGEVEVLVGEGNSGEGGHVTICGET